jgi:hypothetical protein
MGRQDRPFIFKQTHDCGNRRRHYCGDCWTPGKDRRRFTSKARRRDGREICRKAV